MTDTQTRREARLPIARAALTPRSYDAENHTVEMVAATGFPVRRYDWGADTYFNEVLTISEEAIDGSRVDKGVCPLLNAHSSWRIEDQLGSVTNWRVEKSQLILTVRFGGTEAAQAVEREVASGNVRAVSIGYSRREMLKESRSDGKLPTYTVNRWALNEVSMVPVPADPDAGVRADDGFHPCIITETEGKVRAMTPEEQAAAQAAATAETARAAEAARTAGNDGGAS